MGCLWGGLFVSAQTYGIYVASTLGFLVQLDGLPPGWADEEREAFRSLVPGSTQWATASDFHSLSRLAFPRDFVDLRRVQRAAQLRVLHLEARAPGGLDVSRRAQRLRDLRAASHEVARVGCWADWFRRSFWQPLDDNARDLAQVGIIPAAVEERLLRGAARP